MNCHRHKKPDRQQKNKLLEEKGPQSAALDGKKEEIRRMG